MVKQIGYHLTPAKNWLKIQREGLRPYKNIFLLLPYKKIIWLWRENPKSILLDLCIDQYGRGSGTHFVLLEVKYQDDANPEPGVIRHRQTIRVGGSRGVTEERILHDDILVVILTEAVPPQQIKKVADIELGVKEVG
jgi:hypothetical protein